MPYDPQMHHRHSLRLGNYDYVQVGAYFVTLVTQKRQNIFGEVINSELILSAAGELACQTWLDLPDHYPYVELDEFILMPNHLHGILVFEPQSSSGSTNPETAGVIHPLSEIVRGFKSFSASRINVLFHKRGFPVWQRGYYDHIIRDEVDLTHVRAYITNNPRRWLEDVEYQG